MINLTINLDGVLSYSDGTYLPSEVDNVEENRIINSVCPFSGSELVLKAVTDFPDGVMANFPEDDSIQYYDSSYIVVSDSSWITLIRERNITRLLVEPNHDEVERIANIIVKHNIEADVYCAISLIQEPDIYTLETDKSSITFGIDADSETITVTCTGGSGEYVVHDIRKYTTIDYGENVTITKRVPFDNSLNATINDEDPNILVINSFGQLITDNSYYDVTIEHKDMLGLTTTIRVYYGSIEEIGELPTVKSSDTKCEDIELLPISITEPPQEDEIVPSIEITSRDNGEIWINSTDYCDEIEIVTNPMESQIDFRYYGNFIDDVSITDYIDENENITHGLRIKAKPNTLGVRRNCIGYIINAMYPQTRLRIEIHQEANT